MTNHVILVDLVCVSIVYCLFSGYVYASAWFGIFFFYLYYLCSAIPLDPLWWWIPPPPWTEGPPLSCFSTEQPLGVRKASHLEEKASHTWAGAHWSLGLYLFSSSSWLASSILSLCALANRVRTCCRLLSDSVAYWRKDRREGLEKHSTGNSGPLIIIEVRTVFQYGNNKWQTYYY